MKPPTRPGPRRREPTVRDRDFHAQVADALRHLGDVTKLAESPLADLPPVRELWEHSPVLFREGIALAEVVHAVVRAILARLPQHGASRLRYIRTILEVVAIEHRSISEAARRLELSREHLSRTYWAEAVALVADELQTRSILSRAP